MKCEHGHTAAGRGRQILLRAILWLIEEVVWPGSHVRVYSPCAVEGVKERYVEALAAAINGGRAKEEAAPTQGHGQYL